MVGYTFYSDNIVANSFNITHANEIEWTHLELYVIKKKYKNVAI